MGVLWYFVLGIRGTLVEGVAFNYRTNSSLNKS